MKKGFPCVLSWVHTNRNTIFKLIGISCVTIIKCCAPNRLNQLKCNYDDYINKAEKTSKYNSNWYEYFANRLIYGVSPEEYYSYEFPILTDKEKREFVTNINRFYYYDRLNNEAFNHIFDNKYETYLKYRKYYGREIVLFKENDIGQEVIKFIKAHSKIFVKPTNQFFGWGIEIINTSDYENYPDIIEHLKEKGDCVLEEVIISSKFMLDFHPQSVNTVRIPTIRTDEGIRIIQPFLRLGVSGNIVDNCGSGGIFVWINEQNGRTISNGVDELCNEYETHPDTNKQLKGIQLPDWDQLLELVEKLMNVTKEIRYVGWDLAHTDQGWIVVEGNHEGQLVGQMASKIGCRKDIDLLLHSISN